MNYKDYQTLLELLADGSNDRFTTLFGELVIRDYLWKNAFSPMPTLEPAFRPWRSDIVNYVAGLCIPKLRRLKYSQIPSIPGIIVNTIREALRTYKNDVFINLKGNDYLSQVQFSKKVLQTEFDGYVDQVNPFSGDFDEELYDMTLRTLNAMPEPCKSILSLFYLEDLPQERIAAMLGMANANTVSVTKHNCIKKMKKILCGN